VPAISVGSVEVDVLPNATGIRARMQAAVVPAADEVGEEVGRIIGRHISTQVAAAIRNGVTAGGRTAQAPAARQGQATGSTFARSLRTTLAAALRDLPEIRLHANSSDAEREIYQIRAQLRALQDSRIGIDISSAAAVATINHLQERLQRLSASDADVAIRVDAASAATQLAAIQAQVARLDGQTARVDVDTSSAVSGMYVLTTAAIAFGPAIIPVLPVVAAGLGAIASAGVAAGVGIASIGLVALPALKGIGSALQAQKAAQDAATSSTNTGGAAASQAASKALQLQGAQQSLATAERNGARQIAQAQQQVVQAKRAAADAVLQAAQRNQQAARAVQNAERSLADAQRDAKRAQEDLTKARQTARQELEDLNNQLINSTLSQRDAEIALKEATLQRDAVLRSATATDLDKQKALLQYDQAVQRLKEQKAETKDLKKETAAANKAGVEGSETVRNAQDRVAQSQRAVADQARAVKDAQAEAARTQVETARQVADAQQRVGEATANVAVAQQNAADAVASAQRQVQSASMSAAGGVDQAAVAQAKYQAELAKLTPAARETFDAFIDLRSAFTEWSKSLQPAVMPIFTRALIGMRNALPGLTPFVKAAADAIGDLQARASRGFKSPWWKTFKTDLAGSIKPAITGLGVAFGNVFKGMVGIVDAFLPHMDSISSRLQGITGRFAAWGKGLKGSPAFERFLAYSAEHGPLLADALQKIGSGFLSVGQALSPISGPLLKLLGGLAEAIGIIADKAPWMIQLIYGIIVAVRLWTIAQALLNFVMTANPLVLIGIAILALIGFVIYAYNKFDWFRNAVNLAWAAIKLGATAVVDWFKGPFKEFFTVKLPGMFHFVLDWVKRNWPWILGALTGPVGLAVVAIIKNWDKIKSGIASAWASIKKNTLYPIRDFFTKDVPDWATRLKDKVVAAFDLARAGIKLAWNKIKSATKDPVQYVVDVVYNNGIRGVWNKVADAFGAKKLDRFSFASGGIMPGYTPGRDVHRFVSPTGGALELSGGEAIMRPEFTRAVGSNFVGAMNSIAKSRGAEGVKAALAPVFGGNPHTPTDTSLRYRDGGLVQRFADGGIFGWIGSAANKVAGVGSDAWNNIKKSASWLGDTLESSARAGVKKVVDPLLKNFPGMDTGFGKMIRRIPDKILDTLFGYTKKADGKGGGGLGGPKIQTALKWAKTQNGLPYQWAGNGNPSWDCSGFMSAIESVIRGQKPHRRWATGAFSGKTAPPGWVLHGNSPFKIGITNKGVGHTAGTLGKVNVESRGGDGVVVGKRARGYNSSLFNSWYGFKPGSYDSGGYLQPGINLAYNGTGRPEPVFTTTQANALTSLAARSGQQQLGDLHVAVYVGNEQITDIARTEVRTAQGELIQVLNAS
jgi:hypothetical protein